MAEYNIGDKFIFEIINKTDEPLAPYINSQTKNVTVYQLKGIPFMLDADTLSNFEKYEERKRATWIAIEEETGVEAFGFKEKAVCSFQCSACRNEVDVSEGNFNFCPHCGAEMFPTQMSGTKEEV